MKNNELENIVAFCILMENNGGILGKSPSYIREKFNACVKHGAKPFDSNNQKKFYSYFERWGITKGKINDS